MNGRLLKSPKRKLDVCSVNNFYAGFNVLIRIINYLETTLLFFIFRTLRLRRFKSNRNEIWHDYSSHK